MFRHPDHRLLLISVASSQVALQIAYFSVSIIAVVVLKLGEAQIGILNAMDQIALVVFGLLAGAWVDRVRRKPVIVVSETIRALLMLSVPVAWMFDALSLWHMYAVMFLLGLASVFFDVAQASYVPMLIDNDRLTGANSRIQGIRSASDTGGPLAAGPLVSLLTAPISVAVAVAGFAVSAFSFSRIRFQEADPVRPEKPNLRAEIAQGVKFILKDPIIRTVAFSSAWCNLSVGAFQAMLVVFLIRDTGQTSAVVGLILAGSGVGGVLGAMLVGKISAKAGMGPTALVALAVSGPGMAVVAMSGPGWGAVCAFLGQVVYIAAIVMFNVNVVSYRQAVTPDPIQGRVNATQRVITWGSMAVGSILGGFAGEAIGARYVLFIAAGMLFAGCLVLLKTPIRTLRDLPEEGTGLSDAFAGPDPHPPETPEGKHRAD
ncbi:MFS transporter [Glycomyces harbinensis]|uniref:Predicted arabinose efflux permease, MFS family n=1 Tax=Glycomyces harbinensis TaxID=58114 RepID=A0A1G6USU5_9ACTN|nr:MFS transporter [Glycomyces harbinensis]SDD44379.1 Predicted arabinose efflux permease, MFS family [Glycomyces harbinensis]